MSKLPFNDMVTELFQVGLAADHQYERIPWSLAQKLVWYGLDDDPNDPNDKPGDGIALLSCHCGKGNWGMEKGSPLDVDPAGRGWNGVRKGSGGHIIDGTAYRPYGGPSTPHLDSGALLDMYAEFGWPHRRKDWYTKHDGDPVTFDQLRNRGKSKHGDKSWEAWLDWWTSLYHADVQAVKKGDHPPFYCWAMKYWVGKFWEPGFEDLEWDNDEGVLWSVASGTAYSRFSNSASGAAKRHAGKAANVINANYLAYKLEARGKRSFKRTERQISFANRVPVIMASAMIKAL